MDSIDYYNENAALYFETTVDADLSDEIDEFSKHLEEGSSVLDLGCGSGRDALTFYERGFHTTALDGSEEMCKLAEIYTDLEVLCMKFEDLDFINVFDGVWACASLIHVPKKEIGNVLQKVTDALKQNGILFMSFRHGNFEGYENRRYFSDYNKEELVSLIGKITGLEYIDIRLSRDRLKEDQEWITVYAKKTG